MLQPSGSQLHMLAEKQNNRARMRRSKGFLLNVGAALPDYRLREMAILVRRKVDQFSPRGLVAAICSSQ
jgi:hypothetical protein